MILDTSYNNGDPEVILGQIPTVGQHETKQHETKQHENKQQEEKQSAIVNVHLTSMDPNVSRQIAIHMMEIATSSIAAKFAATAGYSSVAISFLALVLSCLLAEWSNTTAIFFGVIATIFIGFALVFLGQDCYNCMRYKKKEQVQVLPTDSSDK